MRIPHVRSLIARAQRAGNHPDTWRKPKSIQQASGKIAVVASFFIMAGVMLFGSAMPAIAAVEQGRMSESQLRQEADGIKKFVEKSSDRDVQDKNSHRKHYQDTFGKDSWMDRWSNKSLLSCDVVKKLTNWLEFIEWLQSKRSTNRLEELYTRVWMMRSDVLQSIPANRQCEGFSNLNADPAVRMGTSDNTRVGFNVTFSEPTLTMVKAYDQTFTRVHIPGVENMVGTPGMPAIPQYRQLIAVPEGATPVLRVARPDRTESLRLNLVPFQEQAVDATTGEGQEDDDVFADKPFKIDQQTYNTRAFLPEKPCKVTPMGQYRDVQMAQLECTTARYNPRTNEYRMYHGMNVEVAFEGGKGSFITNRTMSPFEGAAKLTTEAVVNKEVLAKYVEQLDLSSLQCSGEELLILTHKNFREQADRLAQHKRDTGISTNVFDVGAGIVGRETAQQIDKFIEDRYDDCKVRPSYVMLMGDAEFIPTFYPAGLPDNAGTDFPYSTYVQILFDAFFPDFGTGRLPVDTADQAKTIVDKIIKYEVNPPNMGIGKGDPFYSTVGLASQFQLGRMNADGTPLNDQPGTDQRAFIETSEFVRGELRDRGYNVPRIYTRTVDNGGYCIQENAQGDCVKTQAAYNGDTTPRRYFNGTLLPWAIAPSNNFQWDGSTADISEAWNDGRFLFIHRDHGGPSGWGHPGFSSGNVDALTNGDKLPVVWSVNCASGIFDNETAGGIYGTTPSGTYFAERAIRKADGGAIAVIGDTRNSPTWANNALTRGFSDAVWPDTLPGFGSNVAHKRLGDTLNWGKIYLATQVGVPQTAGSVSVDNMGYEYNIWNLIGDPTLKMWTTNPHRYNLSTKINVEMARLSEVIKYNKNGTTITKLEVNADGEVRAIGRAVVVDGKADMQYVDTPDPEAEVIYSASYNDLSSVKLDARIELPEPLPTANQ